jgi:hypothetical protein
MSQTVKGALTSLSMTTRSSPSVNTETNSTKTFTSARRNLERNCFSRITTCTTPRVVVNNNPVLKTNSKTLLRAINKSLTILPRTNSSNNSTALRLGKDTAATTDSTPAKLNNNSTTNNSSNTLATRVSTKALLITAEPTCEIKLKFKQKVRAVTNTDDSFSRVLILKPHFSRPF